jgi:hypothetical protein
MCRDCPHKNSVVECESFETSTLILECSIHNIAELTGFTEGQPCLRNTQRPLA